MTISSDYRLDCVWIRSRRLKPAIRFYSALLGQPVVQELYNGEIYVFRMSGGRKLLLDDIRAADIREPNARPVAVLTVPELSAAHERAQRLGFAALSPIENGTGCLYFICRDADRNAFAVADRPFPYPGTDGMARGSPIGSEVGGITIPVSDPDVSRALYEEWLGIAARAERRTPADGGFGFRFRDGTPVALAARNGDGEPHVPALRLQAFDLPAAYRHLKAMQAEVSTGLEDAERGRPILFRDCDGRLLAVDPTGPFTGEM
ncbi:VOC family protein [Paenibacillus sp. GYB003]|uniref:VOC family protein n=1 Tax=Paenibacillus sp. GYB003 TaxID=2994392 RepID=UPI002F96124E